jgi:hypothetical protein
MPFSIDSRTVNAPSYPSHAVEANPAKYAQMAIRGAIFPRPTSYRVNGDGIDLGIIWCRDRIGDGSDVTL